LWRSITAIGRDGVYPIFVVVDTGKGNPPAIRRPDWLVTGDDAIVCNAQGITAVSLHHIHRVLVGIFFGVGHKGQTLTVR